MTELNDLVEEFDVVDILEHSDPYALAQIEEGATAVYDGETYTVEEYGTVNGDRFVAGNYEDL